MVHLEVVVLHLEAEEPALERGGQARCKKRQAVPGRLPGLDLLRLAS